MSLENEIKRLTAAIETLNANHRFDTEYRTETTGPIDEPITITVKLPGDDVEEETVQDTPKTIVSTVYGEHDRFGY